MKSDRNILFKCIYWKRKRVCIHTFWNQRVHILYAEVETSCYWNETTTTSNIFITKHTIIATIYYYTSSISHTYTASHFLSTTLHTKDPFFLHLAAQGPLRRFHRIRHRSRPRLFHFYHQLLSSVPRSIVLILHPHLFHSPPRILRRSTHLFKEETMNK